MFPVIRGAGRRVGFGAPWLAAAMLLAACNPTFNWREVRPEGGGIQALMPCKPDTAERTVPLGPVPVVLHMASCETGGITYALAWAALASPADAPAALQAWTAASRQSLRAAQDGEWAPPPVSGAAQVLARALQGQDHAGGHVEARAVYAAQGSRVFQAAAYGPALPAEHLEPFFSNLEVYP